MTSSIPQKLRDEIKTAISESAIDPQRFLPGRLLLALEQAEAERDAATRVASAQRSHVVALIRFVDHLVRHQESHKIPMPMHFIHEVMHASTAAEVHALIDKARGGA